MNNCHPFIFIAEENDRFCCFLLLFLFGGNKYQMNNEYYGYAPSYLASRQPTNTTNIMWTMGLEGAKAYPIAPGRTLLLMDSECAKFYIKTMDANGFATLRTFTFAEEAPITTHPEYVTKDDLEASIAAVLSKLAANSSNESPVPLSQTLI